MEGGEVVVGWAELAVRDWRVGCGVAIVQYFNQQPSVNNAVYIALIAEFHRELAAKWGNYAQVGDGSGAGLAVEDEGV